MADEFASRLLALRNLVAQIGESDAIDVRELVADAVKIAEDAIAERAIALGLANTDPGTLLPNKRYFENRLEAVWEGAARNRDGVGLLIVDIDHFKAYNTEYGHAEADTVLREVGQAIKVSLSRETDVVCRWGGEEFAVLLPHADAAGVLAVGEVVRAAVADLGIEHRGSDTARWLTVSVGAASCVPTHGTDARALFVAADTALLRAKEIGRDRVEAGIIEEPTIDLKRDGMRFTGRVTRVDSNTLVQDFARGKAVTHAVSQLDRIPREGETVTISYAAGRATVVGRQADRAVAEELERA